MKRDKNLQELSRDHHHGLLLGWKIRQGIKNNAEPKVMAKYVAYFADEALLHHFSEEEEQVLNYLPDTDSMKQRTLQEHWVIIQLVNQLKEAPSNSYQALLELADTLDQHIRFEERELFPYLEQTLNSNELEAVGAAIAETHQPFTDQFSDEFWKAN